jgi:hypothetical protein
MVRWALGAPVVAVAAMLFCAKAWGVPWHGITVATAAVAAWVLGGLVQWPSLKPGVERSGMLLALVLASATAFYWAGWRLPRGLVTASAPVVMLGSFQCLLVLCRRQAMPLLAAVFVGVAAAMLVIVKAPIELPAALRFGLIGVVLAGAVAMWRSAGSLVMGDGSQRLARTLVFAAGVWLPLVWWRPGALVGEFLRWENAAFLALIWLVCWARPEPGGTAVPRTRRGWLLSAALVLAAASTAGVFGCLALELEAPRAVFLGVGAGSLVLAAVVGWAGRCGRAGLALSWWPEAAILVMALTVWLR